MSNKRIKELRNLSKEELVVRIREAEAKLFESKLKLKTAQLENTSSIWSMRKDLARMKMLLSEQDQLAQGSTNANTQQQGANP